MAPAMPPPTSSPGNAGNNKLFGLGGNDTINGGARNDILTGGLGKDTSSAAATTLTAASVRT